MSIGFALHDPESTSPYQVEWSDFLAGATIATSTWSIAPSGPTISGQSFLGSVTSCYVSGIAQGALYELTNTVTPVGGQPEQRAVVVRGGQR